jgi:hypothetical protein
MTIEIEQDWIFTFGCNHPHAQNYHVIHGTFEEARQKMVERFGTKWAFQYSSKEKAGVKEFKLKQLF